MSVKFRKLNIVQWSATILAVLALCTGCASTHANIKPYNTGKILLLPPRDVVQNDVPHPKGTGSGKMIEKYLVNSFSGSDFDIITTNSNKFSYTEVADKEKGLDEARTLNCDYCLQIVLGEFLNAAPFTFRPDYVYIDNAVMYDTVTGEPVWQLVEPFYFHKGNPGNHFVLLKQISSVISKSIQENVK
jgi:hypothetical protein